jgi:hypothetical protein
MKFHFPSNATPLLSLSLSLKFLSPVVPPSLSLSLWPDLPPTHLSLSLSLRPDLPPPSVVLVIPFPAPCHRSSASSVKNRRPLSLSPASSGAGLPRPSRRSATLHPPSPAFCIRRIWRPDLSPATLKTKVLRLSLSLAGSVGWCFHYLIEL